MKPDEKCVENDSLQYNKQDLDQEQNVDVNPVQLNTQNLHVHIRCDRDQFAGKITGTTYANMNKDLLSEADIHLYFGNDCGLPVHRTRSDANGYFEINDIPPGFYTIHAMHGENLRYKSFYIKVLPGHNVNLSLFLK